MSLPISLPCSTVPAQDDLHSRCLVSHPWGRTVQPRQSELTINSTLRLNISSPETIIKFVWQDLMWTNCSILANRKPSSHSIFNCHTFFYSLAVTHGRGFISLLLPISDWFLFGITFTLFDVIEVHYYVLKWLTVCQIFVAKNIVQTFQCCTFYV